MCTKIYRVYKWKTETKSTNLGWLYLYHKLINEAAFWFGIWFTDKYVRDLFVINGKSILLYKENKYTCLWKEVKVLLKKTYDMCNFNEI